MKPNNVNDVNALIGQKIEAYMHSSADEAPNHVFTGRVVMGLSDNRLDHFGIVLESESGPARYTSKPSHRLFVRVIDQASKSRGKSSK